MDVKSDSEERNIPMFGRRQYPDGQFPPARGCDSNWHVWCMTGAMSVLTTDDYKDYLDANAGGSYTINFANGSFAQISPEHELWTKLVEISKDYSVEVYRLLWKGCYAPWTGTDGDPTSFDGIKITRKLQDRIAA